MSDKDNTDEFDDFSDSDESGFDEFGNQNTLGDIWRNNPLVKVGVILGGFAVIVAAIIIFGGSKERAPTSIMRTKSDVAAPPADGEITDDYRRRIEQTNIDRVEIAQRQGTSALPTPLDPAKGALLPPEEEPPTEDPLERWRRLQQTRQTQVAVPEKPNQGPAPPDTRGQAVSELSQLMAAQMQSALEAQQPLEAQKKVITETEWLTEIVMAGDLIGENASATAPDDADAEAAEILIPVGDILYAQTLIEANTDAPGPVLVQIVTGPYAGSRMLGEFEATDKYLILTFSTIVIDGVGHETSAVAIDPGTSLPGIVSEIDRRYFKRIVLPMAAAFVEGLTGAIAQSGSTTITISDGGTTQSTSNEDLDREQEVATGLEEAGEEFRDLLKDEADRTVPMIRVKAGTALGILFVEPVLEK